MEDLPTEEILNLRNPQVLRKVTVAVLIGFATLVAHVDEGASEVAKTWRIASVETVWTNWRDRGRSVFEKVCASFQRGEGNIEDADRHRGGALCPSGYHIGPVYNFKRTFKQPLRGHVEDYLSAATGQLRI